MDLDNLNPKSEVGDKLHQWVREGWYRIVKYDLPYGKSPWHLLYVGYFGSVYGVPCSDRGAPGIYNNQLINAENPISVLNALGEVVHQYLYPRPARLWHKAHKLPNKPIVKELDILYTLYKINNSQITNIGELCEMAVMKTTLAEKWAKQAEQPYI